MVIMVVVMMTVMLMISGAECDDGDVEDGDDAG